MSESQGRILAARHAPVEASWRGRCYGCSDAGADVPHAEAAARIEAGLGTGPIHLIWSSPLSRCSAPAALLAARLDLEHRADPRLLELDHGSFEGRAWDEIHRVNPLDLERWGHRWREEGPPGGESALQLQERVAAWLAELDEDQTHLLVAHAGVVRALKVLRGGESWESLVSTPIPHLELMEV